jgi:hypothetical protein
VNQDPEIKCPKCGAGIKLTESLAGPLVAATRAEYEGQLTRSRQAGEELNRRVRDQERELEARKVALDAEVADRVAQERRKADEEARKTVEFETAQLRESLAVAQRAQAEAVRKERELEGRERAVTLTIEQGISDGVRAARDEAVRDAAERSRLVLAEKDAQLEGMRRVIEDLRQKADQKSQQLQGEVQELDLEATLRRRFPLDAIVEVAKGVNGADCEQVVRAPSGAECGKILYESKRTKNWSPGWLAKLREDGRRAGADILVLVSQVLPPEVELFECLDTVWVMQPRTVEGFAAVLRETLLRVHAVRQAQQGMATKAELVYEYLTGTRFRLRIEAVVEAFTTMQEDLEAEKRAVTRAWAKRAAQLEKVMASTTGLFGDLQGISGAALPEIEALGMAALGGGAE